VLINPPLPRGVKHLGLTEKKAMSRNSEHGDFSQYFEHSRFDVFPSFQNVKVKEIGSSLAIGWVIIV